LVKVRELMGVVTVWEPVGREKKAMLSGVVSDGFLRF
jgi:hypothetical protein